MRVGKDGINVGFDVFDGTAVVGAKVGGEDARHPLNLPGYPAQ